MGFQFGGKNWSFRLFFFFFGVERERERERERFKKVPIWDGGAVVELELFLN